MFEISHSRIGQAETKVIHEKIIKRSQALIKTFIFNLSVKERNSRFPFILDWYNVASLLHLEEKDNGWETMYTIIEHYSL